ncbi:MAG TPA: CPBP family intramembrane metalloprotease [Clostridia bacterium]|nr:CPBP family intramembrane metalloprotease [Clostridia bacterium]
MIKKVLIALGKAACYTALFLGAQLAVSMVYALVGGVDAVLPYVYDNSLPDMEAIAAKMAEYLMDHALVVTIFSDLLALGLLWLFFALRKKSFLRETHLHKGVPGLAYLPLIVGGACLAGVVSSILGMLPIPESVWEEYETSSSMLGGAGPLALLASVFVAPFAEEVFFRGAVYTRLRRAMHPVVAAVLSAFVFGLMHGQIIWICYAFVVGLAMAAVFERTFSVRAAVAVHLAFNFAGGYMMSFLETSPVLASAFAAGTALCWIWLSRICPYTKLRPEEI